MEFCGLCGTSTDTKESRPDWFPTSLSDAAFACHLSRDFFRRFALISVRIAVFRPMPATRRISLFPREKSALNEPVPDTTRGVPNRKEYEHGSTSVVYRRQTHRPGWT